MGFCVFSKDYKMCKYTEIESNFLLQFLPEADGNALKVYLLGLYICQNPSANLTAENIAQILQLDVKDVIDSFYYWEDFALVNVLAQEPLTIEYLPIDSAYKTRRISSNKFASFAKELQIVITQRLISTNELNEYFNLLETYSMPPEAMMLIIKYCVDMKGSKINYRYIAAVIKNYGERGIITYEQIENELSDYVIGADKLHKIYTALNVNKKAEIDDQILLKKWQSEYGFEIESILFTAKLIRGGIKKLDQTLKELFFNKRFSQKEIEEFVKSRKKIYEFAYSVVNLFNLGAVNIEPYLETYFYKWLSYGYDQKTILFLAKICFTKNKKSMQDLGELIDSLLAKGLISFDAINQHFTLLAQEDKFILQYFEIIGLSRRPTSWDRQNLNLWRSWNFSSEMIIEAAKRSSSVGNPIPYMNSILSNWKNEGIFNVQQTAASLPKAAAKQQKNSPGFSNNYTESELDKLVESLSNLDF